MENLYAKDRPLTRSGSKMSIFAKLKKTEFWQFLFNFRRKTCLLNSAHPAVEGQSNISTLDAVRVASPAEKPYLYSVLDLQVTLRCNCACLNCIKLCNTHARTGLDYSESDMTMEQIDSFISQIKRFNNKNIIKTVFVTGGEALLHPQIEMIMLKLSELVKLKIIKELCINSNKTAVPPPSISQYIVNFSLPADNPNIHNVALLHPTDFGGKKKTYVECTHYRKNTVVLNYLGYSICCAGDGYIRLFCMNDLILDHLPLTPRGFPLDSMDKICEHCPFSNDDILPLEKHLGYPVSEIYKLEADKNKSGRIISTRF
jgi:hypothetical protein